MKNEQAKLTLVELSLGDNPLYLGSCIHKFLKFLAQPNSLKKIDLSFCGIPFEFLCNALTQSSLDTLENLNFSSNVRLPQGHKSHSTDSKFYKQFFSSTRALKHVDLSNSRFSPDTIVLILEGLRENQSGVKMSLDLSGNPWHPRSQEIASLLGQITILDTLQIYNVMLNDMYQDILRTLSLNSHLKHLYIGKNFRKERYTAGRALLILITQSKLETLSLADCKLKDSLQYLIQGLKSNKYIKVC